MLLMVWDEGNAACDQEEREEHVYTVSYSFETSCEKEKMLQVLYDFTHLLEFMTDVDELEMKKISLSSYYVTYNYKYLFYRSKLVFLKELRTSEDTVVFSLVSAWDNVEFLPALEDVRGNWRVEELPDKSGTRVRYFQRSVFDDELGGFYRRILKKRSIKFLRSLKNYVEESRCRF